MGVLGSSSTGIAGYLAKPTSGQGQRRRYIIPGRVLVPFLKRRMLPASSALTFATDRDTTRRGRLSASTVKGPSLTNFRSARMSKLDSLHRDTLGSIGVEVPTTSSSSNKRKRSQITGQGSPNEPQSHPIVAPVVVLAAPQKRSGDPCRPRVDRCPYGLGSPEHQGQGYRVPKRWPQSGQCARSQQQHSMHDRPPGRCRRWADRLSVGFSLGHQLKVFGL